MSKALEKSLLLNVDFFIILTPKKGIIKRKGLIKLDSGSTNYKAKL